MTADDRAADVVRDRILHVATVSDDRADKDGAGR